MVIRLKDGTGLKVRPGFSAYVLHAFGQMLGFINDDWKVVAIPAESVKQIEP